MYLLGYDIGSSSIKAALVRADNGQVVKIVQSPQTEMDMIAHEAGWAEQNPESWWEHICIATKSLISSTGIDAHQIKSIGIAYQMHGLVVVDENQKALRPSIIWCDSRAVDIGKQAFSDLGESFCLQHLLNSPGNFTASKLKWVKENEPAIYDQIHKMMLPGDYIAMKLTGEICTTISGLSEGMLWDFKKNALASDVLDYYGINEALIPTIKDTFSPQGHTNEQAAMAGLPPGIPVTYRAGDQPNNAMSLAVFETGDVAATAGNTGAWQI